MGKIQKMECPKCKTGKITLDKDFYGWFEYCVQCGYVHDLPNLQKYTGNTAEARH